MGGRLSAEDDAARRAGVPSLDLPGLSEDLIEWDQARALAVELAVAGHMPYGRVDVDYTQTAGFLIHAVRQPGAVRVARLLEPSEAVRPGARIKARERDATVCTQELEAYARVINGPGRTAHVLPDGIQVTFSDPTHEP